MDRYTKPLKAKGYGRKVVESTAKPVKMGKKKSMPKKKGMFK